MRRGKRRRRKQIILELRGLCARGGTRTDAALTSGAMDALIPCHHRSVPSDPRSNPVHTPSIALLVSLHTYYPSCILDMGRIYTRPLIRLPTLLEAGTWLALVFASIYLHFVSSTDALARIYSLFWTRIGELVLSSRSRALHRCFLLFCCRTRIFLVLLFSTYSNCIGLLSVPFPWR